jgi:hypothetical protein
MWCTHWQVTFEAPPGVKRNLQRTYDAWPAEYLGAGSPLRAQLLFVLAWFHAVVQERRTYIPQVTPGSPRSPPQHLAWPACTQWRCLGFCLRRLCRRTSSAPISRVVRAQCNCGCRAQAWAACTSVLRMHVLWRRRLQVRPAEARLCVVAPLQGWTQFYEFSFADLRSAADIIGLSTRDGGIPQWQYLRGLMEMAIYGGRIDNPYDVKVCGARAVAHLLVS